MLLTDSQIRTAIQQGKLSLEEFDEGSLQPASYDMRLGKEAFTSSGREKVDVKSKGSVLIEAGDFAVLISFEKVQMARDMAGHIGLRSHYARKGLILLSGPQIDPGFKGRLVVGVFNSSPRDLIIPYKESFCTVEFHQLTEEVEKPYEGPYQYQEGIPPIDMEYLIQTKGMSFAEVIKTLSALGADVRDLSRSVNTLKWTIPIIVGVGIGTIAIIVSIS